MNISICWTLFYGSCDDHTSYISLFLRCNQQRSRFRPFSPHSWCAAWRWAVIQITLVGTTIVATRQGNAAIIEASSGMELCIVCATNIEQELMRASAKVKRRNEHENCKRISNKIARKKHYHRERVPTKEISSMYDFRALCCGRQRLVPQINDSYADTVLPWNFGMEHRGVWPPKRRAA